MKYCSFDIEIAKVIPDGETDWDAHRPLGISCAATLLSDAKEPVLWFGDKYGPKMSQEDCGELVDYLTSKMHEGYIPLTWNGLGFDFKILAEESGRFEECKELALNHVDMMFQFFCLKGFPVGLDAACKGMGLEGKPEGMNGALAPVIWPTDPRRVLDYVAQDVIEPLRLAELVEQRGWLTWYTRRGTPANVTLGNWLTVRDSIDLPDPDVSWMDDPWPRSKFYGWTEK